MKDMKMICNTLMEKSFEDKVNIARGLTRVIMTILPDSIMAILGTCFVAVGLDGKVTSEEAKLVSQVIGISYTKDELLEQVNSVKSTFDTVLKTISGASEEIKNSFMMLIAVICTCDGEVSDSELRTLEKYFA